MITIQLFFQFCKPLFKIAGDSIYPVFDVVLGVRVGFVPLLFTLFDTSSEKCSI